MDDPQKFLLLSSDQIGMALHPIKANPVSTVVWIEGQTQRLRCKIVEYSEVMNTFYVSLARVPETLKLISRLEKETVVTCLFNVSLPGDNLFFKASYRKSAKGDLNFRIMGDVYKIQRRQHPRLPHREHEH